MIPILIGGTGRSGTSILKRALASHPNVVSIPNELRVIADPGGALDLKAALTYRWSPYNADHAIQRFRRLLLDCASTNLWTRAVVLVLPRLGISPPRYATWQLGHFFGVRYYRRRLDRLIDDLSYHVTGGSWVGSPAYQMPARIYEAGSFSPDEVSEILRDFFDDLFRHRGGDAGQTHWIDDTPYNFVHARDLLDLFPNLRLIHVYRDLRDVLASHRNFRWGGDDPVAIAQRLSNLMRFWVQIRGQLPSSAYMEIGLEALATTPTPLVTQICQFVGLPFDERLEAGLRRIQPDRVHMGRWKHELSNDELTAVLPYLAPFLEAYGYAV